MAIWKHLAAAAALSHARGCMADWIGLPTVPFTAAAAAGKFDLKGVTRVEIDGAFAQHRDADGWTLIPPTLAEFGATFAGDMAGLLGTNLSTCEGAGPALGTVFLTLGNHSAFVDAAGRWTSEGYVVNVTAEGVVVMGASPLGVWWGTRSVLQQAVLGGGVLDLGFAVDSPGWGTRGVMLDAGRHYYPPEFLVEMCNWFSFWKINTFHVHLSDNLYNNVDIYSLERQMSLYSAFRLWTDDPVLDGLNKRRNESYTRDQFDQVQKSCAARGVTVVPEIEAPGHGLVITQWKPELGMDGQIDLLNLTNPDSTALVETIWDIFLPWFHSKVVHIGADEYVDKQLEKGALAEVYNTFVNAMNAYISARGRSIRIWGTFPPQKNYTNNIATNVTMQHWEFFEDNPYFDYIQNNYSVINSDDQFYIVTKYSTSYPQVLNRTRIFHGNPDGGAFAPNIFDQRNATNNPARDSPFVVGHLAAQWNDYGPNTSTYLEGYYSWRDLLPALADKQWGGNVSEEQYDQIFETLQAAAPAQNLDRRIPSKSATILDYTFESDAGTVTDQSGNGYDAKTDCKVSDGSVWITGGCAVTTPLTSKGQDYSLSFQVRQTSDRVGPIFTGPDSELRSGNGTSTALMLVSAGNAFALNYSLPVGEWVDASLIGRGNQTFFSVGKGTEMEFTTKVGVNGERFAWPRIAVVAPLQKFGGGEWEGELKSVKLTSGS